jgi:hypothetical protein
MRSSAYSFASARKAPATLLYHFFALHYTAQAAAYSQRACSRYAMNSCAKDEEG